jgi:hypothetical protein
MALFDDRMEALARGRFESATERYRLDDPTQPFHGAFERANTASSPGGCLLKVVPIGAGIPQVGPATLATLRQGGITTNADVFTHSGRLAQFRRIGPDRAANLRSWADRVTEPHDRLAVHLWHLRQRLVQEKRQRQQVIGCLLLVAAGVVWLLSLV